MPRRSPPHRLLSILEATPDPVCLLDAKLRIAYVNRAWEMLSGLSRESALGLTCAGPEPVSKHSAREIAAVLSPPPKASAEGPAETIGVIPHPDGTRTILRLRFWPLRQPESPTPGWLIHFSALEDGRTSAAADSLRSQTLLLRERLAAQSRDVRLLGAGPAFERLLEQIDLAARSSRPVTIWGEPGTGKRAVARAIHARRTHAGTDFLRFDVESMPPEKLASELLHFDAERHSPAGWRHPTDATLVIGDLARLPRDLQATIAEVLSPRPGVDGPFLILTATADPENLRKTGHLRDDFYNIITTLVLKAAPLRERREELPLLAQHCLELANAGAARPLASLSEPAIRALVAYDWPGNIAELQRVVAAAHLHASGPELTPADLPADIQGHAGSTMAPPRPSAPITPLDQTLERIERGLIEKALKHARQNKSVAADLLAISRPRLYRRLKELGIPDLPENT